jgi:hypothetical protein
MYHTSSGTAPEIDEFQLAYHCKTPQRRIPFRKSSAAGITLEQNISDRGALYFTSACSCPQTVCRQRSRSMPST